MDELTRLEEQILLSVWKLGDKAYGLTIYEHVKDLTGKKMNLSAIYFPLERLVTRRYLDAAKGEPSTVRGGKAKRFYRLTRHGYEALMHQKETGNAFWKALPEPTFAGE